MTARRVNGEPLESDGVTVVVNVSAAEQLHSCANDQHPAVPCTL